MGVTQLAASRLLSTTRSRKRNKLQRSASTLAHEDKFFLKGWPAIVELAKLYAHIHLPVAIVASWMCFYYALLAFLIARRLCTEAVISTPVRPAQLRLLLARMVAS